TGRIPVKRIEAVRKQPNIMSLKAAQPLYPALDATVRELGIEPRLVPQLADAERGRGVVVGIVDFGCDFVHQNFRNVYRSRRIQTLWDQSAPANAESRNGYGRVYSKADIDRALAQPDPYAALRYWPDAGSHGTHVMDIASGNGRGSGVAGCAPEADIIFVQCS